MLNTMYAPLVEFLPLSLANRTPAMDARAEDEAVGTGVRGTRGPGTGAVPPAPPAVVVANEKPKRSSYDDDDEEGYDVENDNRRWVRLGNAQGGRPGNGDKESASREGNGERGSPWSK